MSAYRWEYKKLCTLVEQGYSREPVYHKPTVDDVNKHAAEGWEVIQVCPEWSWVLLGRMTGRAGSEE